MKSAYSLLLLFLLSTNTVCSQPNNEDEWLSANTYELKGPNGYDFSPLKEILKNKRIVALGESTHGLGSFYDVKSQLATYLHNELNFEVLAMEGGLGDIYMVYKSLDTLTVSEIKNNSVFGNFRAKEIDTLFTYMKKQKSTKSPLYYAGIDTQASTNYFVNTLQNYIHKYDNILADSLHTKMSNFQQWYAAGKRNEKEKFKYHRDQFITTSQQLKEILHTNQIAIQEEHKVTDIDFKVIQRTLDMFIASVNFSYEERYTTFGVRDKLMFENIEWLIEKVYPNKKIILWAHNGHVENTPSSVPSVKWMGHYLKEKYGDAYYSIGLFAYQGEAYHYWQRTAIPFKNSGINNIEKKFFNTGKKAAFLSLHTIKNTSNTSWLFNSVDAFEPESLGTISFTPIKRFDAIISLAKGTPPQYQN